MDIDGSTPQLSKNNLFRSINIWIFGKSWCSRNPQFFDVLSVRTPDLCIYPGYYPEITQHFPEFFNKSINRCLPRIRLRPAEKEGWSIIQICAAGKGLLGPWGWMAAVMRKQVHGQSERIDRHPPNTLRQGQTTRLPGTCKNCLEGKATCLRKLVGLSFFFRYHTSILGASSLHHNKPFRIFGMIQPASYEKNNM